MHDKLWPDCPWDEAQQTMFPVGGKKGGPMTKKEQIALAAVALQRARADIEEKEVARRVAGDTWIIASSKLLEAEALLDDEEKEATT